MGGPATIAELEARLETATAVERIALEAELGRRWVRQGVPEQALRWLSSARTHADAVGDRRTVAEIDLEIGGVCALRGEHDRALTLLERALDSAEQQGDLDLRAGVVATLGEQALRRGEVDRAADLFDTARAHFDRYWNGAELARCLVGMALCSCESGRLHDAQALIADALAEATDAGDPLLLGRVDLAVGQVAWARGDADAAVAALRRAIDRFAENDLRRELAEAHLRMGIYCGELSEKGGAVEQPAGHLARAQELFRSLGGLPDLERVREAFRRFGRRATDKVAESEIARLLDELRGQRGSVNDAAGRLHDLVLRKMDQNGDSVTVDELHGAEDTLTRSLAELAAVEERFVTAVNAVVVEREHIRSLVDLTRVLAATTEYQRLPETVARLTCQLTGGDRAVVELTSGEHGAWGIDERLDRAWQEPVRDAGGRILLVGARGADAAQRGNGSRAGARLGPSMVAPLRSGETILGHLWVDKSPSGGLFTERDLDLLAVFAGQAGILLVNARIAEQLRLAARTTTATLEAISDGVLSIDPAGAIKAMNAAAARILGLRTHETPPPGAVPELDVLRGALSRGEELDGRIVQLASGEFLCNARIVRDDDSVPVGLVATFTEMKRATSLAQRMVGSTARYSFGDIIGKSSSIRRTLTLAEAAARSDVSVLITGESGTGKEVLAQAIHNAGGRSAGPFVAVNCAAIPRDLLESELFGYDAGAFTGARKGGRPGKFELAEGGTILLDEIGDMPLDMQAKMLRVLQERTTQRLGGTRETTITCRIVATTNRDLAAEARRGLFRQDLYFRLRVIHIELPPLRDRREDIEFLTKHFLEVYSARAGKRLTKVSPVVMESFVRYGWPGNIRELEHVLESEVTIARADQETLEEVPLMLQQVRAEQQAPVAVPMPDQWPWPYPWWPGQHAQPGMQVPAGWPGMPGMPMPPMPGAGGIKTVEETEKELLVAALTRHRGRIPDVARTLGVSRGTVYNKMRKFNLDPESFR